MTASAPEKTAKPQIGPRHFFRWRRSLEFRLTILVGCVVLVALVLLVGLAVGRSMTQIEQELTQRAGVITDLAARSLSHSLWEVNHDDAIEASLTLLKISDVVGLRLTDEHGKILSEHGFGGELHGIVVKRSIPAPKERGGTLGTLELALSRSSLQSSLQHQIGGAVLAVLLGGMVVLGGVLLTLRQLVFRPVDLLLGAIDGVERNDWQQVVWNSEDQLGRLVQSFNRMVVTVQSNEAELRRAMRAAEQAAQAKDEFLASVSHELRTPLNAILGFSEVLKTELFGPLGSERYRDYAADIHTSGTHLLNVINDILDLSKVAAGKFELIEQVFDLEALVRATILLVQERADRGRVTIGVEVEPHLPALRADELRIKQILLNLLSNAVKFTPAGGQVWVILRQMSNRLEMVVGDTGIGMAPEDIPKAMAPFGQIERVLSRSHEGTGLGLPLVKALCDLHDAGLDIASVSGVGTVITVSFAADRLVWPWSMVEDERQ